MKIEIEVPTPKYKVGEVISFVHETGASVVGLVAQIEYAGKWDFVADKDFYVEAASADYVLAVQAGTLTTAGTPIRPGTIVHIPISWVDDYTQSGVHLVSLSPEEVVQPDTFDNIFQRWDEWKGRD